MLKLIFAGFLILQGHSLAFAQEGQAPSQKCVVGPQERSFGKTKWLLYGCDGTQAAALVPAKGNPAAPFFFLVFRDGENYQIYGEGLGDKNATGAAMAELKSLPEEALAQLVIEARGLKR